ncbi:Flagellum-specific peptidoglycan hydrolase FlgJ [bacterium A37T11]|nr:Flagellum-specific peptidoglycan hydrolase FlgJ [bacterium A37T11]
MKNTVWVIALLLLFSSCLPKHQVLQGRGYNPGKNSSSNRNTKPANSISAQNYINRYSRIAIEEMNAYGIPASITLAQGLLESSNGNSVLAQQANNHFGIKTTSDWAGKTILQDDDKRDDSFRAYNTPEESFRDHSQFLLRNRYAKLFELDKDDYKGWAKGLKKAGYATNPRYPDLLVDLIERYELYRYDKPENAMFKTQREEKVLDEIAETTAKEPIKTEAKPPLKMTIHEVKAGETLFSISNLYGLSVNELKALNNLSDVPISVGQLLLVSK